MALKSMKATRIKACELAAAVMAGRPNDSCAPGLWSLAVFFESYIDEGAAATLKDFGPKKAPVLKLIGKNK
jgi:hypothetical protein